MRKKQNSKLKNRLLSLWWAFFMVVLFWVNLFPSMIGYDSIGEAFSVWWDDLKDVSVNIFVGEPLCKVEV